MRDPAWMTEAFRWCVEVLRVAAAHLGITYEAINIYLFVIIWPLLSVASVVLHVRQWRELRRWRRGRRGGHGALSKGEGG